MAEEEKVQIREVPRSGTPKVKWDTSSMRSAYANVCNVNCTREEVVLLFGLNQAWSGAEEEVTVQIGERIILSPFAAKRLADEARQRMTAPPSRRPCKPDDLTIIALRPAAHTG